MKYSVEYMVRNKLLYSEIIEALSYNHALFKARAEKKRIYNNARRLSGYGIKDIEIKISII